MADDIKWIYLRNHCIDFDTSYNFFSYCLYVRNKKGKYRQFLSLYINAWAVNFDNSSAKESIVAHASINKNKPRIRFSFSFDCGTTFFIRCSLISLWCPTEGLCARYSWHGLQRCSAGPNIHRRVALIRAHELARR